MGRRSNARATSLCALILIVVSGLACDGFTHVRGRVVDPTGRFISDARLRLKTEKSSGDFATTNYLGAFILGGSNAPFKFDFAFTVEKEGYRPYEKKLQSNDDYHEEVVLEPLAPTGKESLIHREKTSESVTLYLPPNYDDLRPSISKLFGQANLTNLRTGTVKGFEVRVWVTSANTPVKCFRIQEETGTYLSVRSDADEVRLKEFAKPQPEWERVFNRLKNAGIFTLPDSSQLGDLPDAGRKEARYIFEIRADDFYRMYSYPATAMYGVTPEAKQLATIAKALDEAFDVHPIRRTSAAEK